MIDELKNFYLRYNYTDEKGFMCNMPTFNSNEHLSIGFDNKRKEFNVHFTDDSIKELGEKRRHFIWTMSAFRFFLFLKRFELFYNQNIINLVLTSKTNLGKLKKHKFIINTFLSSDEAEDRLIQKKKNGKYWKFRKDFDLDNILGNYKYVEETDFSGNSFHLASKLKKNQLLVQGIIFYFDKIDGIYFVPIKKWNHFMRNIAKAIYNYLNYYPTPETLPFREFMYERLKHPYLNNEQVTE